MPSSSNETFFEVVMRFNNKADANMVQASCEAAGFNAEVREVAK